MPLRPEILAPAGSDDALQAALQAGADAVYFGLADFNARARAQNFAIETLPATMAKIHASGARGYVTLNTLIFDDELPDMAKTLQACATAGVDAIIVQDLGVFALAREVAPALPIHASTQMTCTDAASVRFAAELGASRVVVARELSLTDIEAIAREVPVELEVFVHGALCISYSGQCLTSEAIGGRSANRGACAQACRLPYDLLVDDAEVDLPNQPFLLSPTDLDAADLVAELLAVGVRAFKIEGRLKGPDYVRSTVALYRSAIRNDLPAVGRARSVAHQVFSRGSGPGFLCGVDHQRLVEGRTSGHRGPEIGPITGTPRAGSKVWLELRSAVPLRRGDGVLFEGSATNEPRGGKIWMIEQAGRDVDSIFAGSWARVWLGPDRAISETFIGRRVYKSGDAQLARAIEQLPAPAKRPLDLRVSGRSGSPLAIEAIDEFGHSARVETDVSLQPARSRGLDPTILRDKLGRLGDTPFQLRELTIDLDEPTMLPPSALNQARRDLVAEMLRVARADVLVGSTPSRLPSLHATPPLPNGLFVLCRNREQAEAALGAGADGVYLDLLELVGTGPTLRALRTSFGKPIGVAPPRIRKPGEDKIDRFLAGLEPDIFLVRTLGALYEGPEAPLLIGDFSLNVTNRRAAQVVLERGLAGFTPAYDLDASQLARLVTQPELAPRVELVVHHPMPFFHMEHCLFAATLSNGRDFRSCGRPCEHHRLTLRDRTGALHPVEADVGCRNTVFRGAPQSAAELVPELMTAGVGRLRIECVRETPVQVEALVKTYRSLLLGSTTPAGLRRTLARTGQRPIPGSLHVVA